MNTLFLIWRSSLKNKWFPIGKLTNGNGYQFEYIQGVLEAEKECGFQPMEQFPRFEEKYESQDLFPLFTNRVLPENRPEFKEYLENLNLKENGNDPIAILGRSGGLRETDYFELFPLPQLDEIGAYRIKFFARGVSHLPNSSQQRILQLIPQEQLLLVQDFQNGYDNNALLLRTNNALHPNDRDRYIVGYVPRFLADDLANAPLRELEPLKVCVEKVNPPPAPTQFRLLCDLVAKWPDRSKPFSSSLFQPLS